MRRALVLFAFASLGPACTSAAVSVPLSASAPPAPPTASSQAVVAPRASTPSPSPGASVRACRATPSTVYGDEAVVFDLDAAASAAPAEVELFDQQGRTLAKVQLAVPGPWRAPPLPSGDFRLQAGSNRVSCTVTVNRELPRGSQAPR